MKQRSRRGKCLLPCYANDAAKRRGNLSCRWGVTSPEFTVIPLTSRVQGSLNIYNDPYAHSQMAIRTLRAMDDANNPWDAAASDPAGVEEKAAKMKAAYEEEMAAKLAKQAALEAKAATGDARFSDSPATGQDLRYTESSGDGPSFGKFFESFMPGKKK